MKKSIANNNLSTTIFYDISSALVVFLVALPLCLGISLASNAPIISGLLAGIVGGIVIGFFSSSHTSVSGPAAGLTAVVASGIMALGSFEAFLVATIIAGMLQIIMGISRAGFIAAFFPGSVIKGLLFAIGFILILKQIPHLVGLDAALEGDMAFRQANKENTFSELFEIFGHIQISSALIGFFSILFLLLWERIAFLKKSKMPAALAVVLLGVALSFFLAFVDTSLTIGPAHLVQLPVLNGAFEIKKLFTWPDFTILTNPSVYMIAISLSIVASLESLLNLEATDKLDPKQRTSCPNRELLAQGIGNTILGFIGGIPATSVIIRSSVNINSNAQTKKSTIIHGIFLFLSVLMFANILNKIPLSCLAAILIITGFKLAKPSIVKQMWNEGYSQFIPFFLTVVAIVFSDLLVGVMIGLGASLLFILHGNLKTPLRILREKHISGEITRIIFGTQLCFLNKASVTQILDATPNGTHILLDATHTQHIDADMLDTIEDFKNESAPVRNITVSLVGFKKKYEIENKIQYVDHATLELQKNITPKQIIEIFKEGNKRVISGKIISKDLNHQISATSSGQYPLAVILSCIDSRVPAELIFDLGIGNILNIRVAGNVISKKILGSVEFACAMAGAKVIVVMGHTKCGAVLAAMNNQEPSGKYEFLETIINYIKQVIPTQSARKKNVSDENFEYSIIKSNVFQSIEKIKTQSPAIGELLAKNEVEIIGCIYDINNGKADFLNE